MFFGNFGICWDIFQTFGNEVLIFIKYLAINTYFFLISAIQKINQVLNSKIGFMHTIREVGVNPSVDVGHFMHGCSGQIAKDPELRPVCIHIPFCKNAYAQCSKSQSQVA